MKTIWFVLLTLLSLSCQRKVVIRDGLGYGYPPSTSFDVKSSIDWDSDQRQSIYFYDSRQYQLPSSVWGGFTNSTSNGVIKWQGSGIPTFDTIPKKPKQWDRPGEKPFSIVNGKIVYPVTQDSSRRYRPGGDLFGIKIDTTYSIYNTDTLTVKRDTSRGDTLLSPEFSLPKEGIYLALSYFNPVYEWEDTIDMKHVRRPTSYVVYGCPTGGDSLFTIFARNADTSACPGKAVKHVIEDARLDSVFADVIVWRDDHGYTRFLGVKILVRFNTRQFYSLSWDRQELSLFNGLIPYKEHEEVEEIVYLFGDNPINKNYIDRILKIYKE